MSEHMDTTPPRGGWRVPEAPPLDHHVRAAVEALHGLDITKPVPPELTGAVFSLWSYAAHHLGGDVPPDASDARPDDELGDPEGAEEVAVARDRAREAGETK